MIISVATVALAISSAALLLWSWIRYKRLAHIPGPFPASITDFQRAIWARGKKPHLTLQTVHEKYGELVRIGPNHVVFSNSEAIPTVYTTRIGFPKSDFYLALRPYAPGKGALHAIFNTTDEAIHKQLKSPIANLFTPQSVLSYEGHVDEVLSVLHEKLDARHGHILPLSSWLQFFAFDVMGTLSFSKRYGFLDQGRDVGDMMANIKTFMRVAAPWTQVPWLDRIFRKSRLGDWVQRRFFTAPSMSILAFVMKAIEEKKGILHQQQVQGKWKSSSSHDDNDDEDDDAKRSEITKNDALKKDDVDFLTRYLHIRAASPSTIPPWAPTAWTFSNVIAGSDTVSSLMCTTMFNLLRHPHTLARLRAELSSLHVPTSTIGGQSSNRRAFIPRYSEIRGLKYLGACVSEGIRLHPPFSLPLERVVPKGGVEVLGRFLPGGTVVGASPWVVNRDRKTFGEDAEFWRPERWLDYDGEGEGGERRKRMEAGILSFGFGRRICLGKHLGILEITKLVAFLVLNYDLHIVDPEKFEVENSWFFFQDGLYARIEKRK